MKLLGAGPPGGERAAVLLEDGTVRDISEHLDHPQALLPSTAALEQVRQIVDERGADLPVVDTSTTRIGAPMPRPHQILCVGLNYADHAEEAGMDVPSEPVLFNKAPNTLVGPHDDLVLPIASTKVDWEVELGVVISQRTRYLPNEDAAMDAIAGYVAVNDVSERSFQLDRGGQWVKGKSCESFNPTGPWLVTRDEVPDPQALTLELWVNGKLMQSGSTRTMVFSVAHLVWYISQFMVLEPGDLINTGTPPGVGMAREPSRWLRAGDVVELESEGLGRQRQVCVDAEVTQ